MDCNLCSILILSVVSLLLSPTSSSFAASYINLSQNQTHQHSLMVDVSVIPCDAHNLRPDSLMLTDALQTQILWMYCAIAFQTRFLFSTQATGSIGRVSTYSDQNFTRPATSFLAGTSVFVKGEGWPSMTNITLSFLYSSQGNYPVTIASWTLQTGSGGGFTGSLKIGPNGPAGEWRVEAGTSSTASNYTTITVFLPTATAPLLPIPILLAILVFVLGILVELIRRKRRSGRDDYYKSRNKNSLSSLYKMQPDLRRASFISLRLFS